MLWQVTLEDDGIVTLPPEVMATLGWAPGTLLRWIDEADGVSLEAVDLDERSMAE